MKTILLDTNFLLIPGKEGVDIFDELERICLEPYELSVVEGTIQELQHIAQKTDKEGRAATLALRLVELKQMEKNIKIISAHKVFKDVDDFIVELAKKGNVAVATLDRALQQRLDCQKIILRGKDHLAIV